MKKKKLDLSTSQGLLKQAKKSELGEKAEKILSEKGEKKEIFSGGMMSDIIDTVNILDYGVVGMLKGKSFSEGVKTRQSFTDKDSLGKYGIPGTIGGIVLDIAVDPFTYIAPWTIAKKVPGVTKALGAAKKAVFGEMVTKTAKATEKIAPEAQKATKLGVSAEKAIPDTLAQEARKYKSAEEFVKGKDVEIVRDKYGVNINVTETQRRLPAVKEGYERFYRVEGGERGYRETFSKTNIAPIAKGFVEGDTKYVTPKLVDAAFYSENYKAPIKYIDLPKGIAKKVNDAEYLISKSQLTDFFNQSVREGVEGVAKTAPKLTKEIAYQDIEGGTKVGKYLADKFAFRFGKDKVYGEMIDKSTKNILTTNQIVAKISRGIFDLPKNKAVQLLSKDKTGRFIRTPVSKLKDFTPQEIKKVETAWKEIDNWGKQAVDEGLLSKETYQKNMGEYIKNAYLEYEQKKGGVFGALKRKISKQYSREKNLTPEKMIELGQIDNPAYLLGKTLISLVKDVENARLFGNVSERFGSDVALDGFKQIEKAERFGKLAGKWVPQNIHADLTELLKPSTIGMGEKVIGGFKFAKVILNPATHIRNIISNQVLNWWKLGMNPLDPRVINIQRKALAQIAKGGKWVEEAKTVGYNLDTFASNEIRALLDSPEGMSAIGGKFSKIANKLSGIYQGEENFAKLSAFIWNREIKKMGIEDAWKAAESATFNYAQVTPFVRKLRTSIWGYPFITFAIKSTPVALETMAKHPARISVFGKIKNAIENQSDIKETERERASEPQWIKDGFYIKLPMKDKNGRSAYFDLTYILPFGDLMSGNFIESGINRETGLQENKVISLGKKSPIINLVTELGKNQDFYGDKIWKDSDSQEKQLGDIMRHLTKTYLPPLVADQIPGGYMEATGERRLKGVAGALTPEENIKQQRTLMQEMLRTVGMKIQPIDADIQETYMEWEKKKALETLLRENVEKTNFKEFKKGYIAK